MERHAAPDRRTALAIENSGVDGRSLTPQSQLGQINEFYIWASIEFRTRRAIRFTPDADGVALYVIGRVTVAPL